jgi:hypothetical protein
MLVDFLNVELDRCHNGIDFLVDLCIIYNEKIKLRTLRTFI